MLEESSATTTMRSLAVAMAIGAFPGVLVTVVTAPPVNARRLSLLPPNSPQKTSLLVTTMLAGEPMVFCTSETVPPPIAISWTIPLVRSVK